MAELGRLEAIGPPASNAWWPRIRAVFAGKYTDMLSETRGEETGSDLNPSLTPGRRYSEQRNSVAAGLYVQGARGSQSALPTPQELIRQVTGVGDPPQGR